MKKTILLAIFLFSLATIAQENYEVIVLPKKFDFLSQENKYNLNALTKSFFETEGFKVYYADDSLPVEIANNRCNALFADVIESNTFFVTNLQVVIKDCQDKFLYNSVVGSTREKQREKAHNEALRIALTSMRDKLKFENLKSTLVSTDNKSIVKTIIEEEDSIKKQETFAEKIANHDQLFAIPTTTGFKLVDSKPNVVIELKSTTSDAVFIANKGEAIGVFIEKGNGWYFEYYQNNKLISERTEVKF
uniref:hypothetical protein n=1 Tax=Flavobacterium sp. TaxID=239 RepID=UPI00404B03D7